MSWCAGVALLTLHLAGGWWRLTRIARRATPIVTGRLTAALPAIAGRIGVKRKVRLVESALVRVPSVVGWLRPVIVLPISALAGLPPAHLEAILAHELAHIRRGDFAVNVLQCVVETLLFYHPAVWWVSRRIRVERELCCDDMAAALSPTRVAYARALTSLEELQHATRTVAVAANGGELLQRVRRILEPQDVSGSRWSGGVAMSVVLTVLLFTAGGHTLPASDLPLPARVVHTTLQPIDATEALTIERTLSERAETSRPPAPLDTLGPQAPPQAAAPVKAVRAAGRLPASFRDRTAAVIPGATVIVTLRSPRSVESGCGGRRAARPPRRIRPSTAPTRVPTCAVRTRSPICSPACTRCSVSLAGFKTARHRSRSPPTRRSTPRFGSRSGRCTKSVTVRSPLLDAARELPDPVAEHDRPTTSMPPRCTTPRGG